MPAKTHFFSTLPSTNTKAFELAAAGAGHGECVCAEMQTAGRGRLGKTWQSLPGKGLFFSMVVRPHIDVEDYAKLTMTAGLAVAKVLAELCRKEVQLKWPNDIFFSGKKCGGILCEASLAGTNTKERFGIIGIGLNILAQEGDFAPELRKSATSLFMETSLCFDADLLFQRLTDEILNQVKRLEGEGFSGILKDWKERDFLKGKWLSWLTHSRRVIVGKALGPDDNGRLLVRDEQGTVHQVLSGDVTLAVGQKKGAGHDSHGYSSF